MSDPAVADSSEYDSSIELAVTAARIADDKKATQVVVLDVGDVVSITGYFVIASASNARLVRTVAEEIEAGLRTAFDRSPVRTEGMREQQWILVDYGDVVVHVFHETQRDFYALERLYGDVPRIPWTDPSRAEHPGDGPLSSPDADR